MHHTYKLEVSADRSDMKRSRRFRTSGQPADSSHPFLKGLYGSHIELFTTLRDIGRNSVSRIYFLSLELAGETPKNPSTPVRVVVNKCQSFESYKPPSDWHRERLRGLLSDLSCKDPNCVRVVTNAIRVLNLSRPESAIHEVAYIDMPVQGGSPSFGYMRMV